MRHRLAIGDSTAINKSTIGFHEKKYRPRVRQRDRFMENRTKNKFLAYIKYITYGKFGYHAELQSSDETARCESLLAAIKQTPSGSWSGKDTAIKITFLPAEDPRCWWAALAPLLPGWATNLRSSRRVSVTPEKGEEARKCEYKSFNSIVFIITAILSA